MSSKSRKQEEKEQAKRDAQSKLRERRAEAQMREDHGSALFAKFTFHLKPDIAAQRKLPKVMAVRLQSQRPPQDNPRVVARAIKQFQNDMNVADWKDIASHYDYDRQLHVDWLTNIPPKAHE